MPALGQLSGVNKQCVVCLSWVYVPKSHADQKLCSRACHTEFKKGRKLSPTAYAAAIENLRRPKTIPSGEDHHQWKKTPGYRAIHYWVRRQKGSPNVCVSCGKTGGRLQWANISGEYLRDVDDYQSMCASCHKRYDSEKKR